MRLGNSSLASGREFVNYMALHSLIACLILFPCNIARVVARQPVAMPKSSF